MGQMTLMITGAAGYVGRATVAAAREAGHDVIAVVRLAGVIPDGWEDDDGIELIQADLAVPGSVEALNMIGVDAVIHAAASLTGDDAEQERSTLQGTRHLLAAMEQAEDTPRLVLVSSVSVYSGMGIAENATIDETSALERRADLRDAYCRAKLRQEQITADAALSTGAELRIMRLGAVFGPERLWNAHIGPGFGPVLLRLATRGEIPMCHIAHCAEALVRAAEIPVPDGPDGAIEVLNLVDDDLPDRVRFVNAMARTGWPRFIIPLSWRVLDLAAGMLRGVPGRPGLLRREALRARMLPVFYPNTRLKARLDLPATAAFEELFARSIGAEVAEDE
ncbi:NAD(P)-dependent oxidoreductase [Thalassovita sp.]|uniref:NAD-dependent epimerase/dehydratase family protein n=1 Tax=Thalassovita sp. TaxID=1979401 RepID=UPI002882206B|nr:NAD(P)-dependent oxidoreductase [Thalassovita sp.]MDF1802034.1 NAD(P)-dependent oxidoreductase [Thalassovita sp.]